MNALFESSLYFGVFISLAAYGVGVWLKKMTGWSLMNPLFVAIVLVIASISLLGISYDTYNRGAHIITYLLTPSTICLAVPLYQQIDLLKHNKRAFLICFPEHPCDVNGRFVLQKIKPLICLFGIQSAKVLVIMSDLYIIQIFQQNTSGQKVMEGIQPGIQAGFQMVVLCDFDCRI